jgi:hypothetical protein
VIIWKKGMVSSDAGIQKKLEDNISTASVPPNEQETASSEPSSRPGRFPGVQAEQENAQIQLAQINANPSEAESANLGDGSVLGLGRDDLAKGRNVEAQLLELAESLEVLKQQAAKSRSQAEANGQRAEQLRGAAGQLQAGIRSQSQRVLQAVQQLENLVGKLSGTPQGPEMVEWLGQLRDSLAQLVVLGQPKP